MKKFFGSGSESDFSSILKDGEKTRFYLGYIQVDSGSAKFGCIPEETSYIYDNTPPSQPRIINLSSISIGKQSLNLEVLTDEVIVACPEKNLEVKISSDDYSIADQTGYCHDEEAISIPLVAVSQSNSLNLTTGQTESSGEKTDILSPEIGSKSIEEIEKETTRSISISFTDLASNESSKEFTFSFQPDYLGLSANTPGDITLLKDLEMVTQFPTNLDYVTMKVLKPEIKARVRFNQDDGCEILQQDPWQERQQDELLKVDIKNLEDGIYRMLVQVNNFETITCQVTSIIVDRSAPVVSYVINNNESTSSNPFGKIPVSVSSADKDLNHIFIYKGENCLNTEIFETDISQEKNIVYVSPEVMQKIQFSMQVSDFANNLSVCTNAQIDHIAGGVDIPILNAKDVHEGLTNKSPLVIDVIAEGTKQVLIGSSCETLQPYAGNLGNGKEYSLSIGLLPNNLNRIYFQFKGDENISSKCISYSVIHDNIGPKNGLLYFTFTDANSSITIAGVQNIYAHAESNEAETVAISNTPDCSDLNDTSTKSALVNGKLANIAFSLAGLSNGESKSISAIFYDKLGNASACSSTSITYDSTIPSLAISHTDFSAFASTKLTVSSSDIVSFSVVSGSDCSDSDWQSHSLSSTADITLGLETGTKTFAIWGKNAAHVNSPCLVFSIEKTNIIAAAPPSYESTGSVAMSFNSQDASTIHLYETTDCSGTPSESPYADSKTFNFTGRNQTINLSVKLENADGLLSDCSNTFSFIHDDIAPQVELADVITISSAGGSHSTQSNFPNINVSINESSGSDLADLSEVYISTTGCGIDSSWQAYMNSGNQFPVTIGNGSHTIYIKTKDQHGNELASCVSASFSINDVIQGPTLSWDSINPTVPFNLPTIIDADTVYISQTSCFDASAASYAASTFTAAPITAASNGYYNVYAWLSKGSTVSTCSTISVRVNVVSWNYGPTDIPLGGSTVGMGGYSNWLDCQQWCADNASCTAFYHNTYNSYCYYQTDPNPYFHNTAIYGTKAGIKQ